MSPAPLAQVMTGCTVLLTADRRKEELAEALARRGASVRHAPALTIVNHGDDAELLASTRHLVAEPPQVLVVTTGIGFRAWIEAADAAGLAEPLLHALAGTRILARGAKAHGAVLAAGLRADWVARSETSAEVIDHLLGTAVAGQRVAVQHHASGDDGLTARLAAAGAQVHPVVVYRWGPAPDPVALADGVHACAAGELDAVVFTSAPAASAWLQAVRAEGVEAEVLHQLTSGGTVAAVVGPVTAAPLVERGVAPLQPERARLGALVRALADHFAGLAARAPMTVAGRLEVRAQRAVLGGEELPLSPSGRTVLRLLAEAEGGVVPRARLLAALPGVSTDAHAVEVAIARVREVVGRELIKTVVKRGYRLELAAEG